MHFRILPDDHWLLLLHEGWTRHKAMTYNKLVSCPLKCHLAMRVGGYYLLFIIYYALFYTKPANLTAGAWPFSLDFNGNNFRYGTHRKCMRAGNYYIISHGLSLMTIMSMSYRCCWDGDLKIIMMTSYLSYDIVCQSSYFVDPILLSHCYHNTCMSITLYSTDSSYVVIFQNQFHVYVYIVYTIS